MREGAAGAFLILAESVSHWPRGSRNLYEYPGRSQPVSRGLKRVGLRSQGCRVDRRDRSLISDNRDPRPQASTDPIRESAGRMGNLSF
jgi:hypothetical protein